MDLAAGRTALTDGQRRYAPTKPLAVTIAEACRLGGFGKTMAYELISQGKLKTVTIGRRRLVNFRSLEKLLST
jgi:excisionase family DNA binding protein